MVVLPTTEIIEPNKQVEPLDRAIWWLYLFETGVGSPDFQSKSVCFKQKMWI